MRRPGWTRWKLAPTWVLLVLAGCDIGFPLDLSLGPTGPIHFPLSIWVRYHAIGVGDTTTVQVLFSGSYISWSTAPPSIAFFASPGIVTGLAPGTVTITATSGAEVATASLTVVDALCSDDDVMGSLALPDTVNGALETTTCSIAYDQFWGSWPPQYPLGYPDARQAAGWRLVLPETTHVRIDVTSAAFNPAVLVTDSTGWLVAGDHRIIPSMHVVRTLPTGAYNVWAASPGLTATGAFSLSAQTVTPCAPSDSVGAIAIGQTVAGALTLADCYEMPLGYLAEWRTLAIPAATAIRARILNATTVALVILTDSLGGSSAVAWDGTLIYAVTEAAQFRIGVAAEFPGTFNLEITTCTLPCSP